METHLVLEPKTHKRSNLAFVWKIFRNPLEALTELAHEQGDMAHVKLRKRDLFLLSHPEFIEQVLVKQQDNFIKGPSLQRARIILGEGLLTSEGAEHLARVVLVDQSSLGKTPRSNPAVYIGAFDDLREVFAQSDAARQRGLSASAFSFNSAQGQCERCRGAGFEKIEMQFLSDVFIRCPDCGGRRYR